MKWLIWSLFIFQVLLQVESANPCVSRKIPGAETVCVCNATYCDDFPPLKNPGVGKAFVYETTKSGNRFKDSTLTWTANSVNTSDGNKHQVITIDDTKTFQDIIGFGAAFTDFTGFVLSSVPKNLSDSVMKSYFSADGIQYNMGRVPIAGTDYSFKDYTYDDVTDDKSLSHFALAEEDHKYKIPYIKQAQSLSKDIHLFGSPWMAPKWIKINTSQPKNETGGEYYEIWAKYFVKFLDAYKAQNLSMWGITIQNEPTLGHFFDNITERDFLKKNLGPHLEKAGYTPDKFNVMIYDDNIDYGNDKYGKRMVDYADVILGDPEAKKYVKGIAFHWYASSHTTEWPEEDMELIHKNYPEYFTLMTEACNQPYKPYDGPGNGVWDYGERYAHDIIRDINHWAKGWVEWNMVLAINGKSFDKCAKRQCGTSVLLDVEKMEALKQPSFYTIGHFSKFLDRGSRRIGHSLTGEDDKLRVLAMRRPDKGFVAVVLNRNDASVDIQIKHADKYLSHTIPEHSIQTFLWY